MFKYSDDQRQSKVRELELVQDGFEEGRRDQQDVSKNKNFNQQKALDDFATANDNMLADADLPRQKSVNNMTDYTDKLLNDKAAKAEDMQEALDNEDSNTRKRG